MTNPMLVIHCENKWYFQTSAVSSAFTYKNIAKSHHMLLKLYLHQKNYVVPTVVESILLTWKNT